jgi:hypothetical protein
MLVKGVGKHLAQGQARAPRKILHQQMMALIRGGVGILRQIGVRKPAQRRRRRGLLPTLQVHPCGGLLVGTAQAQEQQHGDPKAEHPHGQRPPTRSIAHTPLPAAPRRDTEPGAASSRHITLFMKWKRPGVESRAQRPAHFMLRRPGACAPLDPRERERATASPPKPGFQGAG